MKDFKIRIAEPTDTTLILDFIKCLAEYENLSDLVVASESLIKEAFFENSYANCIIGEYFGVPAAFGVYFFTFSTFLCSPSLYVEDIFVKEKYRGTGIGTAIFYFLASQALKKNCKRLELAVLNWNEQAINFYKKLGGYPLDEWSLCRFNKDALIKLSKKWVSCE